MSFSEAENFEPLPGAASAPHAHMQRFHASDGGALHVYRWEPATPRGMVLLAHGMGEHAARYDALGVRLAAAGWLVLAPDHRGHGYTATPDALGWMGEDGWMRCVRDLQELAEALRFEHPGLPLVLFGHSMGSMLSQQFLPLHGAALDGVILSGSPGFGSALSTWVSHTIARFERWRHGERADSELLQNLLFGKANEAFEQPGVETTGFEWLSRDADQVRKYVEDPLCGFVLRTGSLCDMFAAVRSAAKPASCRQIPAALPMYVFAGSADPVHDDLKGLERMLRRYRDAGIDDITHHWYDGGRHEMLNETNRELVMDDVVTWLTERFPPRR